MQNFCRCDVILVDGDAGILPWHREGTDLLALCNQARIAQNFPNGTSTNVCLLGSAIAAQMFQYLEMVGPKVLGVFNGDGCGSRMKLNLPSVDLSQQAVHLGGIFLDSVTGDCYRWDEKKHQPTLPGSGWTLTQNVGLIHHPSRPTPPTVLHCTNQKPSFDCTCTMVKRETAAVCHWIFQGVLDNQFAAPCLRLWDIIHPHPHYTTLARSMRGTELMADPAEAIVLTLFSFNKRYPASATVLSNWLERKMAMLQRQHDEKGEWRTWMLGLADGGTFGLKFPTPFKPYMDPRCSPGRDLSNERMMRQKKARQNRASKAAEFAQRVQVWDVEARSTKMIAKLLKTNRSQTALSGSWITASNKPKPRLRNPRSPSRISAGTSAPGIKMGDLDTADLSPEERGRQRQAGRVAAMNRSTHRLPCSPIGARVHGTNSFVRTPSKPPRPHWFKQARGEPPTERNLTPALFAMGKFSHATVTRTKRQWAYKPGLVREGCPVVLLPSQLAAIEARTKESPRCWTSPAASTVASEAAGSRRGSRVLQ
eukprot:TRINITY_DN6217_c0_g2_i5.p1 TRINITY_DN6217_c0_g2~~TRINITY_DN6217_c0_g2_i5.p1  ORF type:complete len:537 (+),score=96.93 TRINITY_DN6217_c0_g2_i5:608-2218(+)